MIMYLVYRGYIVAELRFDSTGCVYWFREMPDAEPGMFPVGYKAICDQGQAVKMKFIDTWLRSRFNTRNTDKDDLNLICKKYLEYIQSGAHCLGDGWSLCPVESIDVDEVGGQAIARRSKSQIASLTRATLEKYPMVSRIDEVNGLWYVSFKLECEKDIAAAFVRSVGSRFCRMYGMFHGATTWQYHKDADIWVQVMQLPGSSYDFVSSDVAGCLGLSSKRMGKIQGYAHTVLELTNEPKFVRSFYDMILLDYLLVNTGRFGDNFGFTSVSESVNDVGILTVSPYIITGEALYGGGSYDLSDRRLPSGSFLKWLDSTIKSVPSANYYRWKVKDPYKLLDAIIECKDEMISLGFNPELMETLAARVSHVVIHNMRIMARVFRDDTEYVKTLRTLEMKLADLAMYHKDSSALAENLYEETAVF